MEEQMILPSRETSKIAFIHCNKDGNYYVGFFIDVKCGIHAAGKTVARELMVVGMNKQYFPEFCRRYGVDIKEVNDEKANDL